MPGSGRTRSWPPVPLPGSLRCAVCLSECIVAAGVDIYSSARVKTVAFWWAVLYWWRFVCIMQYRITKERYSYYCTLVLYCILWHTCLALARQTFILACPRSLGLNIFFLSQSVLFYLGRGLFSFCLWHASGSLASSSSSAFTENSLTRGDVANTAAGREKLPLKKKSDF